jgi:hypothetical protein
MKLEESNKNLSAMREQMDVLSRMLKKLYESAELVLKDMQSTVQIKTRERESMRAAYSAYRSAFAILRGDAEDSELYDRVMEFLNEDYARKLAEIEMFMDFSDGIIKTADLTHLAYDARAMEKLDEWERRLDATLLSDARLSAPLAAGGTSRAVGVADARDDAAEAREHEPDDLDLLLHGTALAERERRSRRN